MRENCRREKKSKLAAMNAPRLNLRTTAQVIKQSSISFVSNFYTFLFLSLLLFSFRFIVESGTLFVTTFIDRDPSLKALLSRLDLAGKHVGGGGSGSGSGSSSNGGGDDSFRSSGGGGGGNRRRRPFLHLSRVGTLDDDFFSSDDDDYDRSLFGLGKKTPVNGSSVNLSHFFGNLGFSDSEKNTHDDNGIRVSEIVGSGGFLFKTEGFSFNDENDEDLTTAEGGGGGGDDVDVDVDDDRPPPPPDFQFFIKGLELGRRDAAALFFLVSFLSAAYGWVILGFLVTNSCILGIVFYVVVNNYLRKYNSFVGTIWTGCRLGIRRLSGFILMRWAARDAMTQLLGLWFFSEIEDQHSFFKLFVRLKLMPFSVTSPWIRGFEYEISGFLFSWFLLDTLVALVFAVDSWVAVMDARMSGKEIVKEGCYLISTMLNQAIQIKAFEAILCGSIMRWGLGQIFGNLFAAFLQSVLEVFFMVVWLIYYFAARCKDTSSDGRMFGRRDLEDYIDGIR